MTPLETYSGQADYAVLGADEVAGIQELRKRYPAAKSAILPALWILQHRQGILTAEGMRDVARVLDMPPGPVEAVASFYSMFFFKPHGRYVVEMCTNISCLLNGGVPMLRRLEEKLGTRAGGTTADGLATLLEVECLGACGGAPAAQVNQHPFETGAEAAASSSVVDLANPGANRHQLPADGAGGPVMDLIKGSHRLVNTGSEHPAERGYREPAP